MPGSRTRNKSNADTDAIGDGTTVSYAAIMGINGDDSSTTTDKAEALSNRLVNFRKWLTESGVTVHGALCIVNGEATDGTRNAPVLVMDNNNNSSSKRQPSSESGHLGAIDQDQVLWDRTMGCQLRTTREIKPEDVLMQVPRSAMITPDVIAASGAGKAVAACINSSENSSSGFWNKFENTTVCEQREGNERKFSTSTGPQLLVKALQERKRVEGLEQQILENGNNTNGENSSTDYSLAKARTISTRAVLLAFLIHQRFADGVQPPILMDLDGADESIQLSPSSQASFGPYVRTLPSSVSIPLCWKRNELGLLAGCAPGHQLMVEVATSTMQLGAEFTALLEAGITKRFPEIFPPGLLTWRRWVWAASCVASRSLPASMYFAEGCKTGAEFQQVANQYECQSPGHIWDELGVMVPLMDMLNHESQAHQVEWQSESTGAEVENGEVAHGPRAVVKKKIRKGSEAFTCYGLLSNHELLLRYGFCQINNPDDQVKLGWNLQDAVGRVKTPAQHSPIVACDDHVYESSDADLVGNWWTHDRLRLLEEEAFRTTPELVAAIKKGNRFVWNAMAGGVLDPIFLTIAVVATMPPRDVRHALQTPANSRKLVLTLRHQKMIRNYLNFHLTNRLEKLLAKIHGGLPSHFDSKKLWSKLSDGGIAFKSDGNSDFVGWQEFFDANAYATSIEVEGNYYAMGSDSCVLTLYDGQIRVLQAVIDILKDEARFKQEIVKQMTDLGFEMGTEDSAGDGGSEGSKSASKRNRRKDRKKGGSAANNRQPAMKLHIGNLSYVTTPSDLYDYFSERYGKDNILECHIPIERDTAQSRGFGFVTLPESVAQRVLDESRQHEIGGRYVKVARSNSAGSNSQNRAATSRALGGSGEPGERCSACGYRPRYCVCGSNARNHPSQDRSRDIHRDHGRHGSGPPDPDRHSRHPSPYSGRDRDRDRDRPRERSRTRDRDRDRYDDYDSRYYDDHRERDRYRYDESPPRDYDDRHRSSGRRRRSRSRSSGRSPGRHRAYDDERRSRRRDDQHDDYSVDRKRSRSRSRSRRKKSKRRRSRSRSPSHGSKTGK